LTAEGIEPNPGPRTLKQLKEELKAQYESDQVHETIEYIFKRLKGDLGAAADEADESDVRRWFDDNKNNELGKDYLKLLQQLRELVQPITSNSYSSRSDASPSINNISRLSSLVSRLSSLVSHISRIYISSPCSNNLK